MQQAARTTHTPDGNYAFELSETGLLGSGAHGVVRAARHIASGEFVAVKIMPASVLSSVAKELIAQAKMTHPNIVRLYTTQVDLDRKRVYMILELCQGGELFVRAPPHTTQCHRRQPCRARGGLTPPACTHPPLPVRVRAYRIGLRSRVSWTRPQHVCTSCRQRPPCLTAMPKTSSTAT